MSNDYEVLSPWAEADPIPLKGITPRTAELDGKTIGLFCSRYKPASTPILNAVESRLKEKYPEILLEITRRGLMIGLKMSKDSHGPLLTMLLAKNNVISMFAHNDSSVMIIMPPLVINEEEVNMVLDALDKSYNEMK